MCSTNLKTVFGTGLASVLMLVGTTAMGGMETVPPDEPKSDEAEDRELIGAPQDVVLPRLSDAMSLHTWKEDHFFPYRDLLNEVQEDTEEVFTEAQRVDPLPYDHLTDTVELIHEMAATVEQAADEAAATAHVRDEIEELHSRVDDMDERLMEVADTEHPFWPKDSVVEVSLTGHAAGQLTDPVELSNGQELYPIYVVGNTLDRAVNSEVHAVAMALPLAPNSMDEHNQYALYYGHVYGDPREAPVESHQGGTVELSLVPYAMDYNGIKDYVQDHLNVGDHAWNYMECGEEVCVRLTSPEEDEG